MTPWASLVDTNNPLPEYPRPQMVRSNWLNLNGIWQFQPGITNSNPVPTNQTLSSSILVPFPMESAISGVMQYHAWSWYRRTFTVPSAWSGQRVILHLDAVDWQSQVFVNGQSVGTHQGGYDPFSYDITPYLTGGGPQELIVQVYNPVDNGSQPRGKQTLYPGGIMYTSATGIWQPVWLEPVDSAGVRESGDHSRRGQFPSSPDCQFVRGRRRDRERNGAGRRCVHATASGAAQHRIGPAPPESQTCGRPTTRFSMAFKSR